VTWGIVILLSFSQHLVSWFKILFLANMCLVGEFCGFFHIDLITWSTSFDGGHLFLLCSNIFLMLMKDMEKFVALLDVKASFLWCDALLESVV